MVAPSGEQITIAVGDQQAVIVEVGGGLRSYSAGGRELVDGYSARRDELFRPGSGANPVAKPARGWQLRIRRQAPSTPTERAGAPQRDSRTRPLGHMDRAEREAHRVVMQHVLYPQPGYPFLLRTSIEYALSDRGLRVTDNHYKPWPERCPYGRGAHPYLTLGTATIDRLILPLPARTVLRSDQRGLPIGSKAVEGTSTIFGSRGGSARQCSTMHSLTFNGTRTASLA